MLRTKLMIAAFALSSMAGAAYAAGDAAAGQQRAAGCAGCHGAKGEGNGANPKLAGMPAARFTKAIADYKSGARNNPVMKGMSSGLSAKDVENLAAYYASLK